VYFGRSRGKTSIRALLPEAGLAAVNTRDDAIENSGHIVQFYEDDLALVGAVGLYLAETGREDVAIVIATEAHRLQLEVWLAAERIDRGTVPRERFLMLDAADTLATFMSDGEIDRDAFHEGVGGLLRYAADSGRAIRVYGEMVALLWDGGNVLGAIELETLWNELARELSFSLFCSYPAASVAGSEHGEALREICHLHSSVLWPPEDIPATAREETLAGASDEADPDGSGRELVAEFPAERDSPGRARRLVVTALKRWGHGKILVDDAALVLSELTTNAIVHAVSSFSVEVRAEEAGLRIAVADESPMVAASPAEQGLIPQAGHGLGLTDTLCSRWGVEGTPEGKVVWAELPYEPTAV
jgi:anti-sigma regulatory factor (Ser/Thr protein kinase)